MNFIGKKLININSDLLKLVLCFTVFLIISSCNKKDLQTAQQYSGQRTDIALGVTVRNANAEDIINNVRVIVFASDGKLVSNKVFVVTPDADNKYLLDANVAKGVNDIYVICNETPEMNSKLSAVTSPSGVETMTYSDLSTAPPLSMFSKISSISISVDKSGKATALVGGVQKDVIDVVVTRTMAKISMTIIKNVHVLHNFTVEGISYKICRMPKYSNLMENVVYPQGAGWRSEVKVIGSGTLSNDGDYVKNTTDNTYTVPDALDRIVMPDVYIPEHLPIDKEHPDYCTYLLIEAKCRVDGSSMLINTNYKLDIGNTPPIDHSLNRNTHYNIYATIRNMGAMGFYAEIVPINKIDIPINWKPFEGYVIVSEKASEYGKNSNIWNDYTQYHGVLKIIKNKVVNNALFKYGSTVALVDGTADADFVPADVIWKPTVNTTTISSWSDVGYMSSGDVSASEHTLDNIVLGKGDPCRLAGLTESEIEGGTIDNKLWRMPTDEEIAWLNTARNEYEDVGETIRGKGFYSFSYLLTPNSGYRTAAGRMAIQTSEGNYWSSTGAKAFIFDSSNNTATISTDDPAKAYAIRCIRQTIHPSRLSVIDRINTQYTASNNQTINPSDNYNTPYWKMSVDPTEGFTFLKDKGEYGDPVVFNLTQLPNVYTPRTYTITTTGYGLDGKVHVVKTNLVQHLLTHTLNVTLTTTGLLDASGYLRIPSGGTKLSFKIDIDPMPFPPYDTDFENKQWRAVCISYDTEYHYVYGTYVGYNGVSDVIIPENTYPHAIAYRFDIVPFDAKEYPPYTSIPIVQGYNKVLIQEKK